MPLWVLQDDAFLLLLHKSRVSKPKQHPARLQFVTGFGGAVRFHTPEPLRCIWLLQFSPG